MKEEGPLLFALDSHHDFGERIAQALNASPAPHEHRDFEDGEHKTRPLVGVRDRDVYVVQSLYGEDGDSPSDKLCRLLFFLRAVRDGSASRITAVTPYLCYARKDRKTKAHDPVTTRYVAELFEVVGTDRLIAMDVHNQAAFQNAFRAAISENLQATHLFAHHFANGFPESDFVVVSPDTGGVQRAELFRQALVRETGRPIGIALLEKTRSSGTVRGGAVGGAVFGKVAIVIDDLIASGGTLVRAARACRERGSREVHAAATHGLFVGDAARNISDPALDGIVITDTVPVSRFPKLPADPKLKVIGAADLFAESIQRMHSGESLEGLREYLE